MKLRGAGGKLKIQHSIIKGLRPVLEKILKHEGIKSIIPGAIVPINGAKGSSCMSIRITTPLLTSAGFKGVATGDSLKQELFLNTKLSKMEVDEILIKSLQNSNKYKVEDIESEDERNAISIDLYQYIVKK